MQHALVMGGALLVALAIDRWWGEPTARLHPVVWMGHFLNLAGRKFKPKASPDVRDLKAFSLAALYWWAGAALISIAFYALQIGRAHV